MAIVRIEVTRLALLVDPEANALADRLDLLSSRGATDAAYRLRNGLKSPLPEKIEGDIVSAMFEAATAWLNEEPKSAGLDSEQRARLAILVRALAPIDD